MGQTGGSLYRLLRPPYGGGVMIGNVVARSRCVTRLAAVSYSIAAPNLRSTLRLRHNLKTFLSRNLLLTLFCTAAGFCSPLSVDPTRFYITLIGLVLLFC